MEPNQHKNLHELGAEVEEYVAENTYLCRYDSEDLQPIRARPYVRQVDVYRSKFKIVADLKKTDVAAAEGTSIPTAGLASSDLSESADRCTVDILLHPNLNASDFLLQLSQEAQVDPAEVEHSSRKLRMSVDRSRLKLLATHDCVRAIEEIVPKTTYNNFAREIMGADIILNDTSYHGEGQVVTVSDTGFDNGRKEDCHPAFKDRIADVKSIIRPPELSYDRTGHGTHVCGSIAGQNMISESDVNSPIGGVAQKAKLVVQSMSWESKEGRFEDIRTPLDLTDDLFDPPYYKLGSRIFSNSWGGEWDRINGQRAYSKADAEEIDEFVWKTKDAVVLFSAGNDNLVAKGNPAIRGAAAAKNCITVGATGSRRPVDRNYADVENMSPISSRGRTKEGRIKPDVVAPGVGILSVSSVLIVSVVSSQHG